MNFTRLLALALALAWLPGCQPGPTGEASTPPPPTLKATDAPPTPKAKQSTAAASAETTEPAPAYTYFPLKVGERNIAVQFALTPQEQARGLMHRKSMEPNDGMLFVFPKANQRSFWMRNTRIALDIAYIQPDGVIAEIHPMQPFDESGVPSVSTNIQFALEMNQDWFSVKSVNPGDKIDLAQVRDAMKQRGFDPADYGM